VAKTPVEIRPANRPVAALAPSAQSDANDAVSEQLANDRLAHDPGVAIFHAEVQHRRAEDQATGAQRQLAGHGRGHRCAHGMPEQHHGGCRQAEGFEELAGLPDKKTERIARFRPLGAAMAEQVKADQSPATADQGLGQEVELPVRNGRTVDQHHGRPSRLAVEADVGLTGGEIEP